MARKAEEGGGTESRRLTTTQRGARGAARSRPEWVDTTLRSGPDRLEVRLDVADRDVAVGRPAALEERRAGQGVLLGADLLDDVDREQAAELGRALGVQSPRQGRQEAGPEGVADAGRLDL